MRVVLGDRHTLLVEPGPDNVDRDLFDLYGVRRKAVAEQMRPKRDDSAGCRTKRHPVQQESNTTCDCFAAQVATTQLK